MEQAGYKHFSHAHNLIMHQMPEGIDISCSGCNSSGNGTVYVCWQCNFFLHEQCYRAKRSLKHPLHPHHPLTLVPYPTYLSNSFYCNSCEIIGTGISYSCADCEFDLHVQCAYSISRATSFQKSNQFQELVSSDWNGQNSSMVQNVPDSVQIPFTGAQNSYMPQNSFSNDQYHSTNYDLAYSIPSGYHNSVTTSHDSSMAQNLDYISIQTGPQIPILGAQYPSMPQNEPSVSIPASSHNPIASSQYPSMSQTGPSSFIPTNLVTSSQDLSKPQNGSSVSNSMNSHNPIATVQYPSIDQTESYDSIPNNNPPNPIPRAQDPSISHNGPSVSDPTSSHNPIPSVQYPSVSIPTNPPIPIPNTQDPSMPQNGPSVSIPDSSSQNTISRAQFMTQTGQYVSIPSPQDPSMPQNPPSVSIPPSSQNPTANAQYPSMDQPESSVSIPNKIPPNPIPRAQDPSIPNYGPSASVPPSSHNPIPIPSVQYPAMTQTGPSVPIPTNPSIPIPTSPPNPISTFKDPSIPQNETKDKEIKHFSHTHNLYAHNIQEDEENEVTCSACEDTLVGKGYSCVEKDCKFDLHESCFHLIKEIQHKSHPEHPLTLLALAPYNNKNGEFTCNACFSDGTGFTYNCSICKFDLHIQCVNLPDTVNRDDHEHELKLFYSCPVEGEENLECDVCHGNIQKDRWVYYCESCDYGTHLGCVDCEECEGEISILEAQAELQRLQIRMEMSRQQAEFMARMGASMANLA